MDKSRFDLFAYSSTYLLRDTQDTPLWLPCFSVTVNALKASWCIAIMYDHHGLKDRVITFIVIAMLNYVTGSHCNTSGGCVSIMSFHNDMTPLSIDCSHLMIRKP